MKAHSSPRAPFRLPVLNPLPKPVKVPLSLDSQERLPPKSSSSESQLKKRKDNVCRESKPMVRLREGDVERVGVKAEARLMTAVRQVLDRNNVGMLNSICGAVLTAHRARSN